MTNNTASPLRKPRVLSLRDPAVRPRRRAAVQPRSSTAGGRRGPPLRATRGLQFLVGGVNSPVRAFRRVGADPLIVQSGRGPWLTDAQGRRLLDLIMGWGTLILGHNHPVVIKAVRQQLARGTLLGLTTELEEQLAQIIGHAIPSIERVRFTPSGTEACMVAVRLARAWTKRTKILTFEGGYHGHSDSLLDGAGVPSGLAREQLEAPYNDVAALKKVMARSGSELACAIVEPVAANMGVVVPEGAWLRRLRALTRAHGIVLIFDEMVTGFRLRYGGFQDAIGVGVTPDLTTLGKIIGGGFPIGAVGGRADLMEQLAPKGPVYHAGTFAGHAVAMAAGIAVLSALRQSAPYEHLEALGNRLADGLREAALHARVTARVNQIGSMLTVFFGGGGNRFAAFANALRANGVLIAPSPFEAWFLSTRHATAHIDRIVTAARTAFANARLA